MSIEIIKPNSYRTFYNLHDAFSYQTICPLCNKTLGIDDRYGRLEQEYNPHTSYTTKIIWQSQDNADGVKLELSINLDTNQVEIVRKAIEMDPYLAEDYGGISYHRTVPVYEGLLWERLTVFCKYCEKYSYLIQMVIDTTHQKINSLVLNSENITFIDNMGDTHYVKNIYTAGKTEYTRIDKGPKGMSPITIPLIPIDTKNPERTVKRIKTLILFS